MSSYETAIARMYALGHELAQTPSHKFDLAHMRVLLAALDNPERRFPSVLIAGTNGKGSTAATLASILQASGLRTGLYTSPHLVRINERIQIDGQQIGDDDFALVHDLVDRTAERLVSEGELPWHPSFFEMLTAIAFEYFARRKVDIAVLEVGMGGRLDATNVVEPRVSVITDISLDHQKFLGDTVAEIAAREGGNHPSGRSGGHSAATAPGQRRDREHDSGAGRAGGECGAVCAAGESGQCPVPGPRRRENESGFALSAAGDGQSRSWSRLL